MTIKKKLFFCLNCDNSAFSKEKVTHKDCDAPFYIVEADVSFRLRQTRWERFIDWLLQDITFWLAFMGGCVINTLLLPHFHFNFTQALLESFCWGFLLVGLLKGT